MKTMKRHAANPAPIFFLIIMTSKSWHFFIRMLKPRMIHTKFLIFNFIAFLLSTQCFIIVALYSLC